MDVGIQQSELGVCTRFATELFLDLNPRFGSILCGKFVWVRQLMLRSVLWQGGNSMENSVAFFYVPIIKG